MRLLKKSGDRHGGDCGDRDVHVHPIPVSGIQWPFHHPLKLCLLHQKAAQLGHDAARLQADVVHKEAAKKLQRKVPPVEKGVMSLQTAVVVVRHQRLYVGVGGIVLSRLGNHAHVAH